MEKNRKKKIIFIVSLIVSVLSLSIGFAAFSASLSISSNANVSPDSSTFVVKFSTDKDSLIVDDVEPSDISAGVTATAGIIDNSTSPTLTNLSATFTNPGQYVEYVVYARNEGEYTAYLNSINYYGEKLCESSDDITTNVQSACESINLKVIIGENEYFETTEITGHALEKDVGEEIKIRIEYSSTGGWSDAPFNVTFGDIIMVYSTVDDSTFIPDNSSLNYRKLYDVVKEGAISDSNIDFSSSTGLDNINNTAYVMNSTLNDSNPIYYYRGNVTKNNVRFANFCWKIVRTTETGGVKLIYNGVPADDGSCNNTGTSSQISSSAFNPSSSSASKVGYMYGNDYNVSVKTTGHTNTYIYGNDVKWDGTNYTLIDTKTSSNWSSDMQTLATKYHYTCFNDSGICNEVYYIPSFLNTSVVFYTTFKEGINLEKAKNEMFKNNSDSNIKAVIDNWYKTNLVSFSNKLEDTVWCNDKNIVDGSLHSNNTTGISSNFFGAAIRNEKSFQPKLSCSGNLSSFSVNSSNGNGKLTYPIGLLTADEYTIAGSGFKGYSTLSYLNTGQVQWTMSPYNQGGTSIGVIFLDSNGGMSNTTTIRPCGVRPSISLRVGIRVSDGDGTVSKPYVIE